MTPVSPPCDTAQPFTVIEFNGGKLPGEFNPRRNSWTYYRTQFELFCKANKLSSSGKRTTFLMTIGEETYQILESILCHDPATSDESYEELANHLEDRFKPKVLVTSERFGIINMTQRDGESLSEFMSRIQAKAKTCDLASVKDVRDMCVSLSFLTGVISDETRRKLLETTGSKTSQELLHVAEASETVSKEVVSMKHVETSRVSFVSEKSGNRKSRSRKCFACGETGHMMNQCPSYQVNMIEESETDYDSDGFEPVFY